MQKPRNVSARFSAKKFNAVNLSHYRSGRSLPRKKFLVALSMVLEVDESELMPAMSSKVIVGNTFGGAFVPPFRFGDAFVPPFRIDELPDGNPYLQINQTLPWSVVIRVIEALKSAKVDFTKPEIRHDEIENHREPERGRGRR